jgi:hypothetical protein
MASNSIFMTAAEARQNPTRDAAIHDEARAIEHAILRAVRNGFYQTTVTDGTPMTDGSVANVAAASLDLSSDQITIPNHPFKSGDIVTVSSNGTLPNPLISTAHYTVIYVDANHIKLAASSSDASDPIPFSLDFSVGVVGIDVTDPGRGYLDAPNVSIAPPLSGIGATARAFLSPYGSINSIPVLSPGQGFTAEPIVVISPSGSGATAGNVIFKTASISISSGGSNYRVGDILSLSGGSGTATTATVLSTSTSGAVTGIALGNPGSYSDLPALSDSATVVQPIGGTGCTLNLSMGISSIGVIVGGLGYTSTPAVHIQGNGIGAKALASISSGVVTSIAIIDSGSGYSSAPIITIDGGSGASARAILQSTSVGSYSVIDPGLDTYTQLPLVTVSARGLGATIGSIRMRAVSAILTNSGRGYANGDILLVAGGAGTLNASILVTRVGNFGEILSYSLATGGSYTVLPVLSNNSVLGGTGNLATFNLSMGLHEISVGDPGTGYASEPIIIITSADGNGQGAAARSNLFGDTVGSITVTEAGRGYTSIPIIEMTSGSGATAMATLSPTGVDIIVVTDEGNGWTSATVRIIGDGTGAEASALITDGKITAVIVTEPGMGYTAPPTISIIGDGFGASATASLIPTSLGSIISVNGGENYTSSPDVTVGDALVRANLLPTGVSRITVTDGGENWSSAPVIHVIPGADQIGSTIAPATTSTISRSINHITITEPGSGYDSIPAVSISAPTGSDGSTASALATIGSGTGTLVISLYPDSRDYFKVWKNQAPSDQLYVRPYTERMDTVINYFTSLGYNINRQTNPATGNTLRWHVMW